MEGNPKSKFRGFTTKSALEIRFGPKLAPSWFQEGPGTSKEGPGTKSRGAGMHQGGTEEAMAHWAVLPTKYFVLRIEVLKI